MESPQITVVYLARRGGGYDITTVRNFFRSYNKYKAGIGHELIVISKGWEGFGEEFSKLEFLSKKEKFVLVNFPDEGFDIGSYIRILPYVRTKYVFFLGTSSEIVSDNWLRIFYKAMAKDTSLKLLGCSGSWESLEQSFKQCISGISKSFPRKKRLKRFKAVKKFFFRTIIPSIGLKRLIQFIFKPISFPNYFVRTNAFMIEKELFSSYASRIKFPRKIHHVNLIEHGKDSLTRYILRSGYKVAVIGKRSRLSYPEDWFKDGVYQSPYQDKFLLVQDKRTRIYSSEKIENQKTLERFCWGVSYDRFNSIREEK